ncbi:CPBP family intramembrane metalloprotease domain-containing protein [Salinigranum rubrum]|uniref:CPBP family intramembrane metalloprotease domain-containing protein n=1 Tax=Salinigranum rubrum TaxID=755307 RepID=A0A2I8VNP0_9EURY|nr:type II CAAX endopeptidase family protein [Salinigranum rubrum]AUV83550.1 CPBP family intramembrane metalloprotease domain-containing protein [Salinigranum rubrum]
MASPLASVKRLLWNADERRPRAPWRLIVGVVVIGVVLVVTGLVLAPLQPLLDSLLVESLSLVAVVTVVSGATSAVAIAVVGWVVDRRRLSDFGLGVDRDWWLDLGFGLALGAALMTLVFLVELALGWVVVTGTFSSSGSFAAGFAAILVLFLVVGVQEELLARGYLLTNVCEGLTGWLGDRGATAVAVLLSSVVFGALHLGNPNATLVSALSISLAGVMLALGYVLTDELAIPIGLHITWNLFQGGVYGFPVSGLGLDVALVAVSQRGPTVWTGGAFGPEAGLIGVAAILLGTLATVAYVRARYQVLAVHPSLTAPDLRWRD